MPTPDQTGSPFAAARSLQLADGYGGKIAALAELPIHALGDDYVVEGSGTVRSLPVMPAGISVSLRLLASPTFKNSAKLVCPGGADYVGKPGDLLTARSDGDSVWRLFVKPASGMIVSVVVQVFTSSSTYVPSPGMVFADCEAIGGGGGSGGVTGATGQVRKAGSGAAGSWSKRRLTAAQIGASQTVTIGAAGSAGTATTAGGDGGTTSLGSLLTAPGGGGGVNYDGSIGFGAAGNSGAGGTADISSPGNPGGAGEGVTMTVTAVTGSIAGGSMYGGAGVTRQAGAVAATAGGAATGFGSGASGAVSSNTTSTAAGAAGGAGLLIITEYCMQ